MAAILTGTPEAIVWAAGINPAGQSITIPGDCTAVYWFWHYVHSSTAGQALSSVTLNSLSPDESAEVPTGTSPGTSASGVCAWYNSATGSQTLDPAWDIAPTSGPVSIVVYVKDGNTAGWGDVDIDSQTSTDACSVTLTTNATDLVIKFDGRYGVAPSTSASWTSKQSQANASCGCRASTADSPGAGTTVCDSEDESFSNITAVAILAAAAVGSLLPQQSWINRSPHLRM